MNIQLLKGEFNREETLDLVTHLVHVKIRFHEEKIQQAENEEDIKMREARIKELQRSLYEVRTALRKKGPKLSVMSGIEIE